MVLFYYLLAFFLRADFLNDWLRWLTLPLGLFVSLLFVMVRPGSLHGTAQKFIFVTRLPVGKMSKAYSSSGGVPLLKPPNLLLLDPSDSRVLPLQAILTSKNIKATVFLPDTTLKKGDYQTLVIKKDTTVIDTLTFESDDARDSFLRKIKRAQKVHLFLFLLTLRLTL